MVSLDYRLLGCKPTAPLATVHSTMVGAVLGLFVRPLQRNEANLYDVYTPPPGRGGGGAAAGRQRGGGRESQHVGASTAHGRRSGTRCRGKATVHAATGRATTRASACDGTARQTRARSGRAARRSLRPHGASWRLISSERACLCPRAPPCSPPCPMTDTGANQGHDRGPGWRRSCRLGVRGGGSTDRGT